jgi:hypothetical protein
MDYLFEEFLFREEGWTTIKIERNGCDVVEPCCPECRPKE